MLKVSIFLLFFCFRRASSVELGGGIQVSFCDDKNKDRFAALAEQPPDQLERIHTFNVNRTHFRVDWSADPKICERNVTEYWVEIDTSSWLVNAALHFYGSFPQSTCVAEVSKGTQKVRNQDGSIPNSCSPYLKNCHLKQRVSTLEIPPIAWNIVKWANVNFRVRGRGALAERLECGHADCEYSDDTYPVSYWCMVFEKARSASNEPSESSSWL